MTDGWSLRKFEDRWYEEQLIDHALSETSLTFDVPEDGDTIEVRASSNDGVLYQGDYHFRDGSYSDGRVIFERYSGPKSDVLTGEWKEMGEVGGAWVLKLSRP